jgi:bifunctional UDP-N-acetylglucosamine pyrophosphorylase/glucosamine-1-phosphate N-acetyltransferase
MLAGVTILKPETVTVDSQVKVGLDTVIEPFAQILGDTSIGEDCHIGACSIVHDSELGNRVVVAPFTIIGASRLEDDVHAGPFARLRMENHLETGSRVGNFVELKKARLGAGSKALHLAYLGDSVIGAKTNIGAGTITCNYDGVHKHPTTIGDRAFIGSNSTLVAPIEIGDGSYVAAGSVVTEDVPGDALALGRGRQVNKPGWAKRRREGQER